jgi:uncharacterized protein with HEPN domain
MIRRYIAGVMHEDFMGNPEKQDAVLRRFEIIGEAAHRLAPETQALFPGLPFRQMRGMRNIIAQLDATNNMWNLSFLRADGISEPHHAVWKFCRVFAECRVVEVP